MRTHQVIHGLAILSLFVVALMSIIGSMRQYPGASPEMKFAPIFGLAIWSWLLWKIWKRPRKWGLGVGIFLFLMIVFQSYLWWLGVNDPKLDTHGASRSVASTCSCLRFIALIDCLRARWRRYPPYRRCAGTDRTIRDRGRDDAHRDRPLPACVRAIRRRRP